MIAGFRLRARRARASSRGLPLDAASLCGGARDERPEIGVVASPAVSSSMTGPHGGVSAALIAASSSAVPFCGRNRAWYFVTGASSACWSKS